MALLSPRLLRVLLLPAVMIPLGCGLFGPVLDSSTVQVQAEPKKGERGQEKKPVPVTVKFVGGEGVSYRIQEDAIHDYLLDLSRDPSRHFPAFDAMLELEELFKENGYPLVDLEHQIAQSPDTGGLQVTFKTNQGPLCTIERLEVKDNQNLEKDKLLRFWTQRKSGLLGLGDPLYVRADLETLTEAIRSSYLSKGYLEANATLEEPRPRPSLETPRVVVTIQVTEGRRYVLGRLLIDPQITKALGEGPPKAPAAGAPFSARDVQEFALDLVNHLRARGHPSSTLKTALRPQKEDASVEVLIQGEPGPIATVSAIEIKGNDYVSWSKIRRRIKLEEGQLFDGKLEEESITRLYQTRLFRRIEFRHELEEGNKVRILVEVEETKRYLIQPEIGYGSYEMLRGGLLFEMKDSPIFGFDLSAKGMFSQKGYRVVSTLSDVQLFNTDTAFNLSGEWYRRQEPSYVDRSVGVTPSLSRQLFSNTTGRIGYTFSEHRNLSTDVIDPAASITDYTEGSLFAEIILDSRDSVLRPHSGHQLFVHYRVMEPALGASVDFGKLRAGGSYHLPLGDSLQLALHAEAGWIFPQETSDDIPIQERFTNGGENSVRSFKEAELGPKDINGLPVGGEYRNIFNVELRFEPITNFELALFGDAGNVGKRVGDYNADGLSYAVGAGIRYLLPIGPIRVDAAVNPDQDPGDEEWVVHISVGYPF